MVWERPCCCNGKTQFYSRKKRTNCTDQLFLIKFSIIRPNDKAMYLEMKYSLTEIDRF